MSFPRAASVTGLYAHIPFCFHKCHYCDFYSIVASEDRHESFTNALIAELDHSAKIHNLGSVRHIFVGGGTPTLLKPSCWDRFLEVLARHIDVDRLAEFTVEANPETVTAELLDTLTAGGLNRISIGAQSFNPDSLKELERWHEPTSVGRSVRLARAAGINNLNLDLIFAIPKQTLPMLEADLDALLAHEPDHISCYSLIFEPSTPLTKKLQMGRVSPVGEDLEGRMYQTVIDRLSAAGYEHYEISNWAKPGKRCIHNLAYWHNDNWLGLGPNAASHVGGKRWKVEPHLGRYVAASPTPPRVDEEHLSANQQTGERIMLGLRLLEGIDASWFDEHAGDRRRDTAGELEALGLLERANSQLRLTNRGLFVADSVMAKLL